MAKKEKNVVAATVEVSMFAWSGMWPMLVLCCLVCIEFVDDLSLLGIIHIMTIQQVYSAFAPYLPLLLFAAVNGPLLGWGRCPGTGKLSALLYNVSGVVCYLPLAGQCCK